MSELDALAARTAMLAQAGYFAADSDEVVPSPCISVCRMAADGVHCTGCFRSLDDIRRWTALNSGERRAVWRLALARAELSLPDDLHNEE